MKKVLIFGSFDYLHEGHRNLFEQARAYGQELHAVLARDETIEKVKGRLPKFNERERQEMLAKESLVDKVYLGSKEDKYKIIYEIQPDVIVLGYDQSNFIDKLDEKLQKYGLKSKVIRAVPYFPEKYKSSLLKEKM